MAEDSGSGRPTKWYPEINAELVEFFSGERYRETEIITTGKNDYQKVETKLIPNELPTFERFAHNHDLNGDTLVEWAKKENQDKYPGFSAAYACAKQLQRDFLMQNGMMGLYNPQFTIFVAKNVTDMKDKQETDITSQGERIESMVIYRPEKKSDEGQGKA